MQSFKSSVAPLWNISDMSNKIDKRLVPIFASIQKTRKLLPGEPVTDRLLQLYFDGIKERLDELNKILRDIDTESVLIVQKAGQPTDEIFEHKLAAAIERIEKRSSGILYYVGEIFKNPGKYSAAILETTRQIGANARLMRRQLKRVTNSLYWFFRSWKFAILLLVIGFLAVAAVGAYRAKSGGESGEPRVQSVGEQFQNDAKELRDAADSTTGLDRVVKVTKQLDEIGQLAPAILVAIASMLTAVKGILAALHALKPKN
jgi:hypothetical protein